ncbi:MAG TPA: signal peptidase II [Patescibacteria group bacterium]|nr:signal peptidase II [Patescibacteria group bacterium]
MKHRERAWIAVFIGLFLLDRLVKGVALSGAAREFVPGVLKFELFRNSGIAFSLPLGGPLVWILSVGILAAVSLMAAKEFRAGKAAHAGAFGLFVFGACSNLFDRVVYGYTVDYLIFFDRSAVNVADGMIVAGAIWLLLRDREK